MLKQRLKKGEYVLGTWCEIPSPVTINIMAKAGLDFVIIDMEHGAMDYKIAQEMIMAAEAEGCEAIVRVPFNDESSILRALDIGATGIIVPQIESREERDKVIKSSKFAPIGNRGFNPYIRSGSYNGGNLNYVKEQNERVIVGIIIEGKNGIENLEEIISHPEIDVVYIGTYDLSVVLGVPGDINNKLVQDILSEMVIKINEKGKSAGCMIHNLDDLKNFKELGIKFITYKTDTAIMYDSFNRMKKEI